MAFKTFKSYCCYICSFVYFFGRIKRFELELEPFAYVAIVDFKRYLDANPRGPKTYESFGLNILTLERIFLGKKGILEEVKSRFILIC
jgi:hypothetical protein